MPTKATRFQRMHWLRYHYFAHRAMIVTYDSWKHEYLVLLLLFVNWKGVYVEAWKIPWMEEPGRLQSMGSLRVRHDWATSLSLFTFMHWRRRWQPTSVFLPAESQGQGSVVAAVYGVAQSRTQLKWLSSSSSYVEANISSVLVLKLFKDYLSFFPPKYVF